MPSPISQAIGALIAELNQKLAIEMDLETPFQDEATLPGQRFGVVDPQSWIRPQNDFQPYTDLNCNLWLFSSYASFAEAQSGSAAMMADADHGLLKIAHAGINSHGILLEMVAPQQLSKGLRAPIIMPNTQTKHLWIADVTGPLTLRLAIDRNVCGHVR